MTDEQALQQVLQRMKRKLLVERFVHRLLAVLFYAGCLCLLAGLLSRVILLPVLYPVYLIILSVTLVVALGITLWKSPGYEDAAVNMDRLGLEERLTTAWQFRNDPSELAVKQRAEAIERGRAAQSSVKKRTLNVSKKWISSTSVVLFLFFINLIVPNEMQQEAVALKKEAEIVDQVKQKVEEKTEQVLPELDNVPSLREQLQMNEVNSAEELMERLLKNEKELNQLLEQKQNEWDESKLTAEQRQLLEDLAMNRKQVEQISQLQNTMQQSALTLQQNMINAGLPSPVSGPLAFSGNGNAAGKGTSNGKRGQGEGDAGSGEGEGAGGSGEGNVKGTGQGSGSGSGQGAGGGQGSGSGSGSGQGSGSGSGGSGSGQGGGQGNGAGLGTGSRNLVTVPPRIEGGSGSFTDTGELGEGPSEWQYTNQGPTLRGTSRSYEEVFQTYESQARNSLERHDLPDHLQEKVRQYFGSIEP